MDSEVEIDSADNIDDVSGIILAGGSSSRLGQHKALLDIAGQPMIERVVALLRVVVDEIVLVTNAPKRFAFLKLPMTQDIYRDIGTLGGLHAGLSAIRTDFGLAVGCDMPFLNPDLLRYMISQRRGVDVVMPRIGKYHEPLHALYANRCLPAMERSILSGQRRILPALAPMQVRYVKEDQIARYDPHHLSFFNVNTPDDLERMKRLLGHNA